MNYIVKTITFLLFVSIVLHHKQLEAQERDIEMLAGLLKPPFVIPDENKGMQIEIIDAAFELSNYRVRYIYLPLSRHMDVYKKRNIEGLITLSENETELGLYLSKPYITYENVVVTLADNKLAVETMADLSGKRVAAFQNAIKFLGEEYRNTFLFSESYIELSDQKSQLSLLFNDRVDAIVLEKNIFKHLHKILTKESDDIMYQQKVTAHFLFNPRHYVAGFNSKELQEAFDKGIETIKLNGRYQQIVDSYLK